VSSENFVTTLLSVSELFQAVQGERIPQQKNCTEFSFTSVATDSRKVVQKSLFIPLLGQTQDGHSYIPQALKKGASVVLINRNYYRAHTEELRAIAGAHTNVWFIIVENTLHALQAAAAAYVAKFPSLIRIGITGSSGKTTTKEIAAAVLSSMYTVITNEGNLNSETGLPLSVFNIRPEHEIGIFEMGMNRKNEIGEIAAVLKPEYALVTNIGTAHIGLLGSRFNIAVEKKKIFSYMSENGVAFIPSDDDFAEFLGQGLKGRIVRYGPKVSESVSGVKFIRNNGMNGTEFLVDGIRITCPLPGIYNYTNVLAAIALAKSLHIPALKIKSGIESIRFIPGRGEVIPLKIKEATITIIQDCYNANPDSMAKALDFIASLHPAGRKICVLGDMRELGPSSAAAHFEIGSKVAAIGAAYVIFIGDEMANAMEGFGGNKRIDQTVNYFQAADENTMLQAAELLSAYVQNGDVVLLKGSRSLRLERITACLQGKKEFCDG
jgi:UDP-N-acetylmuramoyl-tripeptide--D-alanyl-D-alanine ligase